MHCIFHNTFFRFDFLSIFSYFLRGKRFFIQISSRFLLLLLKPSKSCYSEMTFGLEKEMTTESKNHLLFIVILDLNSYNKLFCHLFLPINQITFVNNFSLNTYFSWKQLLKSNHKLMVNNIYSKIHLL